MTARNRTTRNTLVELALLAALAWLLWAFVGRTLAYTHAVAGLARERDRLGQVVVQKSRAGEPCEEEKGRLAELTQRLYDAGGAGR